MNFLNQEDTICALSTAGGMGAIALIRLSGKNAIEIVEKVFSKTLADKNSHTVHFGQIRRDQVILDEVLVTILRNPRSFTGEDQLEITCHGSVYIQSQLLALLLEKGARLAEPGEFSMRAFMNGKMDLSQTEAIADLISSTSEAAHKVAMHQMRGGFSEEINELRQSLMDFASLVELELDFSEEDVEFADRAQLIDLVDKVNAKVAVLLHSYKLGNVIKNGVPVAIVGSPNAGKSTLLNALLKEEKAIVSPIAGTTRDVIEDTIVLNGINFRFIDTAGLRETKDSIERLGIERAYAQIRKASVILLLIDLSETKSAAVLNQIEKFRTQALTETQTLIPVFNKLDEVKNADFEELKGKGVFISAKNNWHLDELIEHLSAEVAGYGQTNETIVTNVRHYEILKKCELSLQRVQEGLKNQIPGDLLAMDIRETLHHLGEITGQITSDDLLGNIFANFCIGK
jgi:tRNA modification GTPase